MAGTRKKVVKTWYRTFPKVRDMGGHDVSGGQEVVSRGGRYGTEVIRCGNRVVKGWCKVLR